MNILQFVSIDKSESTPLYVQLASELEKAMHQGVLRHGDFLPTEKLICDAFDVSPKVVLTAYQQLAEKALVRRLVGKGTQVHLRPVLDLNFKDVLNVETLKNVTLKNVYFYQELKEGNIPVEHSYLNVLHQVGQINDYPVIFRKIYMNPDIYPDEIVFDNVIEHTKTLFSAEDIELESKLIVVNLPELESAYLDLDAGSPGYYFRTMITHQKKGIAFVKTYFSGEYTVWRHHPETIRF